MIRNRTDNKRFVFQPSHALLATDILKHIDTTFLHEISHVKELQIAVELHDIGWAGWEQKPTINGLTGFPYDFTGIPVHDHLAIWENCSRTVCTMNLFAALLVSMHTTYLADRHDATNDTQKEKKAFKSFIQSENNFQEQLFNTLSNDMQYQDVDSERLEVMRSWIGFCDYLSLLLCMQGFHNQLITDVPDALGTSQVSITQIRDYENRYVVEPWIFDSNDLTLRCDSVILDGPFDASDELTLGRSTEGMHSSVVPHTVILQKEP